MGKKSSRKGREEKKAEQKAEKKKPPPLNYFVFDVASVMAYQQCSRACQTYMASLMDAACKHSSTKSLMVGQRNESGKVYKAFTIAGPDDLEHALRYRDEIEGAICMLCLPAAAYCILLFIMRCFPHLPPAFSSAFCFSL